MQKQTTLTAKLSRFALAAVMVAGVMAGIPSQEAPLAGLGNDAIRLSQPVPDRGDAQIRDMPVLAGRAYQG